jgi:HD-GYP domain-containing protein (c-di-GMP phosphodiesterase class II)
MPSWSSQSPDQRDEGAELRRRFVEASRRAEIIALVNRAGSEVELADVVTSELCEAFDAEFAFLVGLKQDGGRLELIGSTGLGPDQVPILLDDALLTGTLRAPRPTIHLGSDLFGIGAAAAALTRAGDAVLGVARLRAEAFDDAERALLEAIGESTGHSLTRARVTRERDDLFRRLEQTNLGIAEALAAALEAKDFYTADHARSIADLAMLVGVEMGMTLNEVRDLRLGAIFHDIGKIAVPDAILNKPGKLTAEEFEIVKAHTIVGEQILAPVPFLDGVRRIVRHDHERWDGRGYPDELRGDAIPLGSRIVFVVDSFHAMTSDRPYRKAMAESEAIGELNTNAGTQFDPAVVEAFVRVLGRRRRAPSAASPEAQRI